MKSQRRFFSLVNKCGDVDHRARCLRGTHFISEGSNHALETVTSGSMKGEAPQKIIFGDGDDGTRILYNPPYSNWTRKFQPFEFVYNGRQIYFDDQRTDAIPFNMSDKKWASYGYATKDHGPLNGKTSRQLWEQYRLAIGGRLAPADAIPCPEIRGGWYGSDVPFDPPMESEPNSAYYGGAQYERLLGKAKPDAVTVHPRWEYDPIHVDTPRKAYVATVTIDGTVYHSAPTDLTPGVNLIPIQVGSVMRYLPVGSPLSRKGGTY